MEGVLKNADISVLSNFLAIFFQIFFSIWRNVTMYYLHAKFQINWTIQKEITEWGRIPLALPICKKPSLFRVKCSTDV